MQTICEQLTFIQNFIQYQLIIMLIFFVSSKIILYGNFGWCEYLKLYIIVDIRTVHKLCIYYYTHNISITSCWVRVCFFSSHLITELLS